jgi:hypothetical protein
MAGIIEKVRNAIEDSLAVVDSDEDTKVKDPTEPDLRLTRQEWTIFWKTKYEQAATKMVAIARESDTMSKRMRATLEQFDKQLKDKDQEIAELTAQIEELSKVKKQGKIKAKTKTTRGKKKK